VSVDADTMVSGDFDLLPMGSFSAITVQRVAEVLARGRHL
jgi:hypothetical protein